MKQVSETLKRTTKSLESSTHPRVSVAWQDINLVYRRVYNPSPDLGQDILGKKLGDLVQDSAEVRRLEKLKGKVVRSGKPYREELVVVLGDKKHYYDLSIEPTYDENGNLDGLMSVNVDITDLIEARARLAEANDRLLKLLDETLEVQPVGRSKR